MGGFHETCSWKEKQESKKEHGKEYNTKRDQNAIQNECTQYKLGNLNKGQNYLEWLVQR